MAKNKVVRVEVNSREEQLCYQMGVPIDTPVIEAVKDDPDPFFSNPIDIVMEKQDYIEGQRANHGNCAIAVAIRRGAHATAALINSRAVKIASNYPRNGMAVKHRGKLVIREMQLSHAAQKIVKEFDKNPTAATQAVIRILPLTRTQTRASRKQTAGTGKPHITVHNPNKPRPTYLRTRIAKRKK